MQVNENKEFRNLNRKSSHSAVTGVLMQVRTLRVQTVQTIRQMSRSFVYLAPAVSIHSLFCVHSSVVQTA